MLTFKGVEGRSSSSVCFGYKQLLEHISPWQNFCSFLSFPCAMGCTGSQELTFILKVCLFQLLFFVDSYPPIPPKVIYTHIGIFVTCGFLLSFRYKRKEVSLVYCGQILYLVYTLFTNPHIGYTDWQKVRLTGIQCHSELLNF